MKVAGYDCPVCKAIESEVAMNEELSPVARELVAHLKKAAELVETLDTLSRDVIIEWGGLRDLFRRFQERIGDESEGEK